MWGFLHWGRPLILCLVDRPTELIAFLFIYVNRQKQKTKCLPTVLRQETCWKIFQYCLCFFAFEDEGFSKRKLKGAHIAILGQMVQVPFCPVSSIIASSLPPNSCNLSVPLHSMYPCLYFVHFEVWNWSRVIACYSEWSASDEMEGFIQCLPSPNSVRRNQVFISGEPKKGDKCPSAAFSVWVGGSGLVFEPVPSLCSREI